MTILPEKGLQIHAHFKQVHMHTQKDTERNQLLHQVIPGPLSIVRKVRVQIEPNVYVPYRKDKNQNRIGEPYLVQKT
jgi:tRNA A37 threonylcarbamoyladenosine synthetase subunit TsaC/SUA5/YrdC